MGPAAQRVTNGLALARGEIGTNLTRSGRLWPGLPSGGHKPSSPLLSHPHISRPTGRGSQTLASPSTRPSGHRVFRYKSSLLLAQLGDSCSTPRRPARFVLIFGPSLGVGWGAVVGLGRCGCGGGWFADWFYFIGNFSAGKDEQALEPHDLRREPPGRHPGEGGGGSLLQGEVF